MLTGVKGASSAGPGCGARGRLDTLDVRTPHGHRAGMLPPGLALLVAIAVAGTAAAQPSTAGAGAHAAEQAAAVVIEQVNTLRVRNDLPPLRADPALTRAAEDFAQYMARTGRYGHQADGRPPPARAQAHGYAYCIVDENIGWIERAPPPSAAALAGALYDGWQASPPHRRNLLDPDVVDTGVGLARRDANGRWYAVQMFGRPRSAEIAFSITDAGTSALRYRLGERSFTLEPGATRMHRQCRPSTLTLASPDASPHTITPRNGAHYDAVAAGGGWRLAPR
jgi:uncharacterized protein YkwD